MASRSDGFLQLTKTAEELMGRTLNIFGGPGTVTADGSITAHRIAQRETVRERERESTGSCFSKSLIYMTTLATAARLGKLENDLK